MNVQIGAQILRTFTTRPKKPSFFQFSHMSEDILCSDWSIISDWFGPILTLCVISCKNRELCYGMFNQTTASHISM